MRIIKIWAPILVMLLLTSCQKGDVDNCSTCEGPNVAQAFDVCEENGKIFVDGEEIPELEGISLERVIRELEANTENEEVFEDLSCR